jgi:hypothetical protein
MLTKAQKEELLEIELRGRFMTMSADMEWAMLLIMTHLAANPLEQVRKFTGMMLHNKIEATIADLKKFKPDLYAQYETDILLLWDFKEFRNDMGHHKIDISDDLTSFRFLYADEYEGHERIFEKKHSVEDMMGNINIFKKLVLTLTEIFLQIGGQMPVIPPEW